MEKYNIPEPNSLDSMEGINNDNIEKNINESENNSEIIKRKFIEDITGDAKIIINLCSTREQMGLNSLMNKEWVDKLESSTIDLLRISKMDKIDDKEFSEALNEFSKSIYEFGNADKTGVVKEDLDILINFMQVFQGLSSHVEQVKNDIDQNGESEDLLENLEKLQDLSIKRKQYIERLYNMISEYLGR